MLSGCTIVLKTSPFTPLTTLRIAELIADKVPAGVVNIITGDDDLGPMITAHPDIDKITFTGSTATGKKIMIYGELDLDVQETWAVTGVYPNMDWTPDSQSIVFWAGGKLRRVDRDGSNASVIPFTIDDSRGVADAPRPAIDVAPDQFVTTMPRFGVMSPDGSRVVFESLGKLHFKSAMGRDAPRPLTGDMSDTIELWPAFSRDGSQLTYIRWSDEGLGEVVVADANGQNPRVVTNQPGHYAHPQFSPDGSMNGIGRP